MPSGSAMTVPAIERDVLDTPGDVRPRPHSNCYWLIPGALLAGEHPAPSLERIDRMSRIDALLDAGARQFIDLTEEGEGPVPYAATLRERARSRSLLPLIAGLRFPISACRRPR
jgi:hypothetical protein